MPIRTEKIDVSFNLKLQKDLQEHEIICSHCGGTGLQVDDHPFGLKSENSKIYLPYKQQTIVGCRHCYNGAQSKCLHCGKILVRGTSRCDCKQSNLERLQEQYEKDVEIWNKAKKISFEQACKDYVMIYIDNYDKYLMVEELEEWIEDNKESEADQLIMREELRIYSTQSIELSMDASNIIEDACSDLHEDARDNISVQEEEKLKTLLDKWCEDNGANDISNGIPSCRSCNSQKWQLNFEEWFREQKFFTEDRLDFIIWWIMEGYKDIIEDKPPYKVVKKQNEHDKKFHWELWSMDEQRNMVECLIFKNKKSEVVEQIQKYFKV